MLGRRGLLAAPALVAGWGARAADPVWAGVSGPLTGPNAQYGAQWKRGFDLALDGVNAAGSGPPLQYVFEDTQADPRQAVTVAQKFVGDPRIVIEIGDFASAASMAASPIYQRAGLVQLGFTNSHPDFTRGGDHMWSNCTTQTEEMPRYATFVASLGMKRPALVFANSDWGRASAEQFAAAAPGAGLVLAAREGFLANEQDFRSTLVRARDGGADGLVVIAYYAEAALICRQARDTGMTVPIAVGSSCYSPKFLELGGAAVDGVHTMSTFVPEDTRPEVREFVTRFVARYGAQPDLFSAFAFDTMVLWGRLVAGWGATRAGMQAGLLAVRDVPSVIYGRMTFDPDTRRVRGAAWKYLIVKNGAFALAGDA